MTDTVGFIGLGNVGLPAAVNLLESGYGVLGHDLIPSPALVKAGGVMASLTDLARCAVIVQSLPTPAALTATLDQLVPLLRPGQVIIELSSYPLAVKIAQAERVAATGAVLLDCEVSGLPFMIANRTAVLFKAGDQDAVEACAPIFDALAGAHYYLGAFGAATKMKLIANMMVCVHDLMAAEALILGQAAGLDPAQIVEVLKPSAAGSATFANKAPLMVSRAFDEGRGPFRHMFGYLDRATELAEQAGVTSALALLPAVREVFALAKAQGRHDQDIAAIIEVIEQLPVKGAAA